jgi:hypothetical protein
MGKAWTFRGQLMFVVWAPRLGTSGGVEVYGRRTCVLGSMAAGCGPRAACVCGALGGFGGRSVARYVVATGREGAETREQLMVLTSKTCTGTK